MASSWVATSIMRSLEYEQYAHGNVPALPCRSSCSNSARSVGRMVPQNRQRPEPTVPLLPAVGVGVGVGVGNAGALAIAIVVKAGGAGSCAATDAGAYTDGGAGNGEGGRGSADAVPPWINRNAHTVTEHEA